MISTGEEMVVQRVAGGSITEHRPVFSSDSMSLYVIWDDGVRQYSVKTGQCTQKLDSPVESAIVGLQIDPLDSSLLYAITCNGELLCWKPEKHDTGVFDSLTDLTLDLSTDKRVTGFHMTATAIVVVVDDQTKDIQKYILYNRKTKEKENLTVIGQLGQFSSSVGGAGGDDQFLATIHVKNLRIVNLKTLAKFKHLYNFDWGNLTCVRAHQSQMMVATCDEAGRILIWHDFTSETTPAVKSLYHWHKLPVNDVVFTGQASCFYSGGSETVLVKWWMDDVSKDFLTNMGATIKNLAISQDSKYVAVGMADNAIHIIEPTLKYHQTIQHVSTNFEQRGGVKPTISRLAYDPRTKALIVNGRSGHVQFYSVEKQEYLFKVDVVNQNYLNKERDLELVNTEVVLTAISSDGNWLATVEERDDGSSHQECRLKLWNWHWQDMFKLITSIENPHHGKINDIAFEPESDGSLRLISTGSNGKFIVWGALEDCSPWKYDFVGNYDNLIPKPVEFSPDGSIFGIGFEHALTMWSSKDFEVKCTLSRPGVTEKINFIKFGLGDASRFVVSTSSSLVSIWDLLTMRLSRLINLKVCSLASNPLNNNMAAFTPKGELIIFSPSSNVPILRKKLSIEGEVSSAVYMPVNKAMKNRIGWEERAKLYFLTDKQEIFTLADRDLENDSESRDAVFLPPKDDSILNPIAACVSIRNVSHGNVAEPVHKWQQQLDYYNGSYLKMICSTPAHMMPPMQLLLGELVQECLNSQCSDSKSAATSDKDQAEDMQVDENDDSSDDETPKRKVKKEDKVLDAGSKKELLSEDKMKQVVNEDTQWVSMLFDSMQASGEN